MTLNTSIVALLSVWSFPDRTREILAENERIQVSIAKELTKGWFNKPARKKRVRKRPVE